MKNILFWKLIKEEADEKLVHLVFFLSEETVVLNKKLVFYLKKSLFQQSKVISSCVHHSLAFKNK